MDVLGSKRATLMFVAFSSNVFESRLLTNEPHGREHFDVLPIDTTLLIPANGISRANPSREAVEYRLVFVCGGLSIDPFLSSRNASPYRDHKCQCSARNGVSA